MYEGCSSVNLSKIISLNTQLMEIQHVNVYIVGIGNVLDLNSLKYFLCDKAKRNLIVRVKLLDICTKVSK